METKYCRDCEQDKPITEFSTNKAKKDGLAVYCKPCYQKRSQKHYSENKQKYANHRVRKRGILKEWFEGYKMTLKCERCQEDRWYVLDFHHENPNEKEHNVSKMIHDCWSLENIQKEIEKCKVLCSNCHRELHHLEN